MHHVEVKVVVFLFIAVIHIPIVNALIPESRVTYHILHSYREEHLLLRQRFHLA